MEPFVPRRDHNPVELSSWAKRTGFVSNFSGETTRMIGQSEKKESSAFDLEKGIDPKNVSPSPKIEIDPILGRAKNRGIEIELESGSGHGFPKNEANDVLRLRDGHNDPDENPGRNVTVLSKNGHMNSGLTGNGNETATNGSGFELAPVTSAAEVKKQAGGIDTEVGINNLHLDSEEPPPYGVWQSSSSVLNCGLRDNPGIGPLLYYGLQHYLSLAGSLIFTPLVVVPVMGGTDKDTANMISTMLLMTGITTILHSFFGTRLPLVQGSSFVFLAPALVISNSRDYRNLTEHKFRHIMRELQGAIIVGSIFQTILGFSGFMSLLLRLINPVVVAPTVAAVGLAFFNYGFPQAGSCVEISLPLIVLVLIFTLYLRGISILGQRLFQIYAVPLCVVITWAYAFFLTAGGAYNYKGCNANIPTSNILIDSCRKHVYTMKHCRTDVSNAWRTAYWVRIPYPFQWGMPTFHLRTSIIMIVVSLVASVESVGTYHSASLRAHLKAPTPGIVSRGIGLEGFCSILAGLWGTTAGSTTLMENVHTFDITKVASRRAIDLGSVCLIFLSFIGKLGGILASIPEALAASALCFMWALMVALGLTTIQYSQTSSLRNLIIVGVSLFLGLSIPAYFQQYQPLSSLMLPSYLLPYSAASDGPVHSGNEQIDFSINALLSMNMVVTLLLAILLDNTVPGSRGERRVYIWSRPEDIATDPSSLADYSLPRKAAWLCRWARCLDV